MPFTQTGGLLTSQNSGTYAAAGTGTAQGAPHPARRPLSPGAPDVRGGRQSCGSAAPGLGGRP